MAKRTAGLVMLRRDASILLVHPGGPYFRNRDEGIWGIPKGAIERGETPFAAARREFKEETGYQPPDNTLFADLGSIRQGNGKRVYAWGFVDEWDPSLLQSNTYELEWPPNSGNMQTFPEVDRADFFSVDEARKKGVYSQWPLIERALESCLGIRL